MVEVPPLAFASLSPRAQCLSVRHTVEPLFWDTSIQGTQSLVPEKRSHSLCIYYLY